ncbi:precorrin-3B synthase [Sphingomonas paucimobilis]|nr:precorrin-3B synthase [Sphingomonas paucimobilis]
MTRNDATEALIRLAHWFVASGGAKAGRMARLRVPLPAWASGDVPPASAAPPLRPGAHPMGAVYGLPFGRIAAGALGAFATEYRAPIRLTPWRMLLAEGVVPRPASDMLLEDASILHVDACVGAPAVRRPASRPAIWPPGSPRWSRAACTYRVAQRAARGHGRRIGC